tara:strand:- start:1080 stop:1994 length:915 start_codon:yes stop_codon:yes gene_type:complete
MKIFLSKINESWIVDRVRQEWYNSNKNIGTQRISKADIIWIISPWLWKKIPKKHLIEKRVLCSYYHFDFDNFDYEEFKDLDQYVDQYHVISEKTKKDLETLTSKKIISIPFWVNQEIFYEIKDKKTLKKEMGFNDNEFLIGSFQRDTEGSDLISPKLIKGPDTFLRLIKEIIKDKENLKVVLSGKRRGYLINNFEKEGIPYEYFEMVNLEELNKLYNVLDLYLVTSRIEGGPQAILECGISKTPILSTDVGVASEILDPASIFNENNFTKAKANPDLAYKNSLEFIMPKGIQKFNLMLKELYES